MEQAIHVKNTMFAVLAAVGGFIANLLGGWDVTLKVLVGCMAADYISGLIVAGVFHRSGKSETGALESRAGFKGLLRKCMILLLVFLAAMLDLVTGQHFIRSAVCLFYIANEGLSIIENLVLMGVPHPAFLDNVLEALRKQGDKAGKEDNDGNGEKGG